VFKKLFKESLIYGLSRYLAKFIGVFLLPLYTAVLHPSDYGILDLLGTISLVSMFLIVSGTDAAFAFYYFRKEFEQEKKAIVSTAMWIRLIFSSLVFIITLAGSSIISQILFGTDHRLFIIITGLTVAFNSIFFFLLELLRFEFKPWLYTTVATSSVLLSILLTVYFVLIARQGVFGAVIANCISFFIVAMVSVVYVFKNYGFGLSKKWFKDIVKYGYPLIATGIAVWVLTSTDRYFLAHFSNLTAVGIYAVGIKVAAIMGMLTGAFQMAWGPFSMEIQNESNAKRIYAGIFFLFSLLALLGIFYVSMFSIDVLKVLTNPSYYSAKMVVPFLCISSVLSSAYFLAVLGMNLTKKLEHTIWITASAAAFNIILSYILTPRIGAIGASFSIMTANFLIVVLTFKTSQKYYYIKYDYLKVLTLALPAFAVIGLSYYYNFKLIPRIILSFLYSIFAFIFVYRSYKHTDELKRVIEKISVFKQKLFPQPDSNNIN
jgi:O-antigen/teichoic acid export membrane protein